MNWIWAVGGLSDLVDAMFCQIPAQHLKNGQVHCHDKGSSFCFGPVETGAFTMTMHPHIFELFLYDYPL